MSYHYAITVGRTPELAKAELLAVADFFQIYVKEALHPEMLRVERNTPFTQEELATLQRTLGGVMRISELTKQAGKTSLLAACVQLVHEHAPEEGKLIIGLSVWSADTRQYPVMTLARNLKKALNRSVRVVVPQEPHSSLSSAQLIHNKLVNSAASETGKAMDLTCIWTGESWFVGRTRTVQDIASYTERDFGIPVPDPVSGMLPPKLAQTMVNLGVGNERALAVYDPFCGNGRIILEANLLGLPTFASDIKPEQVKATQDNSEWLAQQYDLPKNDKNLIWQADATQGPGRTIGQPFVIVTEPYLGKPLRDALRPEQAADWLADITPTLEGFFAYWAKAAEKPQHMLVVFPRTRLTNGQDASTLETLVDRLEAFGYSPEVLYSYSRPDSIVRRDLVRITYSQ